MTNHQRDTDVSLFLRFRTSPARQESLVKMVERVGGFEAINHLEGLSYDAGNADLIFSFPLSKSDLREGLTRIQACFLRLYDFHPALSEIPSDAQKAAAAEYIKSLQPQAQRQLQLV